MRIGLLNIADYDFNSGNVADSTATDAGNFIYATDYTGTDKDPFLLLTISTTAFPIRFDMQGGRFDILGGEFTIK